MKKINYFKIGFDLLIAITFALLFNTRVLGGLTFHETAGIAIGGALLVHILLNSKWIKNVTIKIFDPKLSAKLRFSYVLNLLLLISMATVIITGIMISRVLFPNLFLGDNRGVRGLHTLSAYLTLAIVGVHVGLHWQWVMNVCKKIFVTRARKPRLTGIAAAIVVIAILFGSIQMVASKSSVQTAGFNFEHKQSGGQGFNGGPAGNHIGASGTAPFNNRNGNNDFQDRGNGGFGDHHGDRGDFGKRGGGSPFSVILKYFVILAVIIVPTYYLEKRIFRTKSKIKQDFSQS